MSPRTEASHLIRELGVSMAAQNVGNKVRRWARWGDNGNDFAISRMRYWLAVDWHIHHNPSLPEA